MFACFRNGAYSVLCTVNIITVRPETNLEGLPHVGIVIDDQNVRLTHFATYLVPAKLERERTKLPSRVLKKSLSFSICRCY
jgi:hypothetical protein